jgi:hypothetical protein
VTGLYQLGTVAHDMFLVQYPGIRVRYRCGQIQAYTSVGEDVSCLITFDGVTKQYPDGTVALD